MIIKKFVGSTLLAHERSADEKVDIYINFSIVSKAVARGIKKSPKSLNIFFIYLATSKQRNLGKNKEKVVKVAEYI